MIEGRSSIGRLGISIHATAGFGDIGFFGYWTLEISCIEPVRIYPGIRICQIFYHTVKGKIIHYHGKYQDNDGIQASQSYLDSI
jgi:dCTP deaminase